MHTSAFVYLLHTRLALHTTQSIFCHLLGHVYRPDAGACAHIENANFSVGWHRGLVQCVSPCYREHLVVDVHAVLFRLGVSVGKWPWGSPTGVACSPRRTDIGRCLSGSRGSSGHFQGNCCFERARAICGFVSCLRFLAFQIGSAVDAVPAVLLMTPDARCAS